MALVVGHTLYNQDHTTIDSGAVGLNAALFDISLAFLVIAALHFGHSGVHSFGGGGVV
jgi:hypothetical protein